MITYGYDATHDNVSSIRHDAAVVLGYGTGTRDVAWTPEDWSRFTTDRKVVIDQGGPGSPIRTAHVRDVEQYAWDPVHAVTHTDGWNVPRPTIYCNRDYLPLVLRAGWRGDLWLAIPSAAPPVSPPVIPGCKVVAVQYRFTAAYDESVIFDDWWPRKAWSMGMELQPMWRHCGKCQGLFYGPNESVSVCPRGGNHDGTGSGDYGLVDQVTDTPVT